MRIPFTKMEGAGNDFLVLDARPDSNSKADNLVAALTRETVQKLGHRRTGIGFDQLLLIEAPANPVHAISYRIFNSDGSEVQQCGNGARALGAYVASVNPVASDTTNEAIPGEIIPGEIIMESVSGIVIARLLEDGQVSVNMGTPNFDPVSLPFVALAQATEYILDILGQSIEFGAVSMGNPHVTILVEEVANVAIEPIAQAFQNHPSFPESVNVGFMQIEHRDRVKLRVYERGAGETLACGTGSCAAVAIGQSLGILSNKVLVNAPGGELLVSWAGDGQNIWLTGACRTVFKGYVEL